ncbi:MAG: TetR/AcrR family transcriptional regulator [Dehalococcoidia bacterium]
MSRVTDAHVEARRESILEAAVEVFARKGMQTATMAEIAEAAGLSAGAIYRYFPNKEALATACMHDSTGHILDDWRQLGADGADPRDVFNAIARGSFDEMKAPDAPQHTLLMVENQLTAARSGNSAYAAEVQHEHTLIVAGLAEAIARMQEAGSFPAELDANLTAESLMALYVGTRIARLLNPSLDSDAMLTQVAGLMALAAESAARGTRLAGLPA